MKFKLFILAFSTIVFFNCKNDKKEQIKLQDTETEADNAYIEVVTKSMEFIGADTIPSGWNTFKYINESTEPHFIMIDDYPDGKTIDTIKARVMPPFDKGMELIMEGKMDEAMAAFGELPEWFGEVVFLGGTGLISPKHVAYSTVKLEPGPYIMECYVKMPNGQFHVSMGMVKEFWVTSEDSGNLPPTSDVKINISSTEGITYEDNIKSGAQIFEVYFKDQVVHENFIGHDINLVKLEENTDIDALEAWMNWVNPKGLMSSSVPAGVTFLGGVNNSPAGSTQYFEVDLVPGNYALISEVPNTSSKNMLKTFTVTD